MAAEDIDPFIVAYIKANPGCALSHLEANCPPGNQPGDVLVHLHGLLAAGSVIRIMRKVNGFPHSAFFPGPA